MWCRGSVVRLKSQEPGPTAGLTGPHEVLGDRLVVSSQGVTSSDRLGLLREMERLTEGQAGSRRADQRPWRHPGQRQWTSAVEG